MLQIYRILVTVLFVYFLVANVSCTLSKSDRGKKKKEKEKAQPEAEAIVETVQQVSHYMLSILHNKCLFKLIQFKSIVFVPRHIKWRGIILSPVSAGMRAQV